MKCSLFLKIGAVVVLGNAATAAVGPGSWQRSIELLKTNNSSYKAAEYTFQSTESLETSSRSGFWPSLTGSLSYDKSGGASTSSDSDNLYSATLSLNQNLFAGLKDTYSSRQAQARTRAASFVFQTTKAKISYEFTEAYQSVLTAQENLKLTENIVSRRQNNLRLVQLRFEGGRENKGSVFLSEAYLAQAKYEKLLAQNSLDLVRTTLAHQLGISAEEIKLDQEVPLLNSPPTPPNFDEIARITPAFQQAIANLDADVAAVGLARASFFPTLSLYGSVGRNDLHFFPEKERWSVGASLSIPLFNGGRDWASLQSAKFTREASGQNKSSANQTEVQNLKSNYQKMIESLEKLKVDESFQKAAMVRADVARNQYNNGLITFNDWDTIENDLILRQKNFLQSKKQRVLSEAAWKQALGEGVLP